MDSQADSIYVAFCCENSFLDRISLPISAGPFPLVGKTREDAVLASLGTSEGMWDIFLLSLWIHFLPTFFLLCAPEGKPGWTASFSSLAHWLSVPFRQYWKWGGDLQAEGELDHNIYAQTPSHPGYQGLTASLKKRSQFVPPFALSDTEVVTVLALGGCTNPCGFPTFCSHLCT